MAKLPNSRDGFTWRASRAVISEDGPFSIFEGIERHLALLEGAGINLTLQGKGESELEPLRNVLTFSGSDTVYSLRKDPSVPCEDFNWMVDVQ